MGEQERSMGSRVMLPFLALVSGWIDNDTIKVVEKMEDEEQPEALCPWPTSGSCLAICKHADSE